MTPSRVAPRRGGDSVKGMGRALVVIDVQNEYVTRNLPISQPPVTESLARIQQAIDTAEEARIPVVLVQQTAPAGSPIFAAGSHGARLHPGVAARRHDLLVTKTLPSAFTDTVLDEWLRAHGVDTIAIVGYMTQNCDESTARDAAHRGYAVEFLSDATDTLALANDAGTITAKALHEAVLVILQSRFAAVATTAEWVAAVTAGRPLCGSNIYTSTGITRTPERE